MFNLFYGSRITKICKKTLRRYRFYLIKENPRVRSLRRQGFKLLENQISALAREGFAEELLLNILNKKATLIDQIYTYEELSWLAVCSYPRFNGTEYVSSVPEKYYLPEEECIHWARFFSGGIKSEAAEARYNIVLSEAFPDLDKSDVLEIKKNQLKKM